jgi:hypothetical protein
MATHKPPFSENGVLFDDIWDPTVLERFKPLLVTEDLHCPILGAQEGFTRALKMQPGMFQILQESQPLLLPAGKLMITTLTYEVIVYPCTIVLLEVCKSTSHLEYIGQSRLDMQISKAVSRVH